MGNSDLYVELVGQMLGQMLGAVDRTMLSAGTSEANLQMSELPLNETLHMIIHHVVDIVQELRDTTVVLKEFDDFLVKSGELAVMLVFARIVDRAAVKHITTAVAGRVNRDAFL